MIYKIIIALIFFIPAFISTVDWMIFSNNKANLELPHEDFKAKYRNHFPDFLQSFTQDTTLHIIIVLAAFLISGFILIFIKNRFCVTLGIISFSLAALHLWWLM